MLQLSSALKGKSVDSLENKGAGREGNVASAPEEIMLQISPLPQDNKILFLQESSGISIPSHLPRLLQDAVPSRTPARLHAGLSTKPGSVLNSNQLTKWTETA